MSAESSGPSAANEHAFFPTTFAPSAVLLLLGALGAGAAGVLFLSNATSGAGLICAGCLLAIWARMLQAAQHHRDVMRALKTVRDDVGKT